ncbi:MAG: serine protease [Pseudanabaenaceae cyanobacterium]
MLTPAIGLVLAIPMVASTPPHRIVLPSPRTVTVRLIYEKGAGSGVIVARRGQRYLVLTNYHVVNDAYDKSKPYIVHTFDGRQHRGHYLARVGGLDAAFVVFSARESYPVARLGRADRLAPNSNLTAVGFPNWVMLSPNLVENTMPKGFQAYTETQGSFRQLIPAQHGLREGYRLGYSNDVQIGMSGGAIFSSDNLLVGINGRLKQPFQEQTAYQLESGAYPTAKDYEAMRSLSWGIPIEALLSDIQRHKEGL